MIDAADHVTNFRSVEASSHERTYLWRGLHAWCDG
jgi:hypothetical protein